MSDVHADGNPSNSAATHRPATPVALQSVWTLVHGRAMHGRIHERSQDDLPPIVLVHGFGVSGRYLLPTAERLAVEHSVFVPDLPGFGQSEGPRRALSIEQLADALGTWMAALQIERPIVLGNSLGCQIVAELASRAGNPVAQAILVAPSIDPSARTSFRQIVAVLKDALREPPSLSWLVAREFLSAGPRRLHGTLRSALRHRIEDKLPHVDCPTLVVHCGNDPFVSESWAREAARLLPDGELIIVPNATHTINYTAPETLIRAIRPFLSRRS